MVRNRARLWWLDGLVALIAVFLIAPSVVVVVMSFSSGYLMTFPPPGFGLDWYRNFFALSRWTESAVTSLQIALLSTALATTLGTLCAFGFDRGRPPAGSAIIGLILSPLIVPVVITAIGMFMTYQRMGIGSFVGLVAAHSVMGIPYVFIAVWAALQQVDPDLELAAANLGATPTKGFLKITVPLILPSILIGGIFAFASSWDEVVIAIFLATPQLRTLPVTMWEETRQSVDPTIAAASSMLTAATLLVLLVILVFRPTSSGDRAPLQAQG
jgi:putative spermidine/putrescine transport system permease protein